jgi:hypothetical protein
LRKIIIILTLIFSTVYSYGQISPGELTQSHAKLEGMSNCTMCHDLGSKVSNRKCLECHDEIKALLNQKKGYHAAPSVINKNCFDCHSEHHGRKFDMVRFNKDAFNHNQTSFKLDGKHKVTDCRKCHVSENIQNPKIKKRKNTFLGLDHKCFTCHEDYHQKTLSNDCSKCHNTEAFKPAAKFDHDKTNFKLRNKHNLLECKECHAVTTENGKKFQKFGNIPFGDCKVCHKDPHNRQLPGKCKQCHSDASFSTFIGRGRFNHNTTNFRLKGSHRKANCFSCHLKTSNPKLVFQDKIQKKENDCVSCHDDNHKGKYGNECAKCHNETSFLSLNSMKSFDHNVADYHLEGKHLTVDCKKCHKGRYSTPIDFSACKNCHTDYHRGQFAKNGVSPDCNECHSLKNGFDYSLYTLEKHQKTKFPLEGAHTATPCFACHVSKNRWTFKNLGSKCNDCHQDIHKGKIAERFYPGNDCKVCHENDSWSEVKFDHTRTKWPLEGKHLEVKCSECHFKKIKNSTKFTQKFYKLESKCISCHENIHGNQFAIKGVTDCKRCHSPNNWNPDNFNHNATGFPLEGRHAEIACNKCHKAQIVNGKKKTYYKIEKHECKDCHK